MIVAVSGKVLHTGQKSVFIETNSGLSYEVFPPTTFLSECAANETVRLYTYLHIRENEMELYGFRDLTEREWFTKLISIKGIGPKMGMEIISSSVDILKQAIAQQDYVILTQIKGMGKKTAERVLLELKSMELPDIAVQNTATPAHVLQDACDALVQLGYDRYEVNKAFKDIPEDMTETEDVIKWFLSHSLV